MFSQHNDHRHRHAETTTKQILTSYVIGHKLRKHLIHKDHIYIIGRKFSKVDTYIKKDTACTMEANLKAEFDELMKNENVTGFIATNENGLCLMASPNVNEELSGVWYSIARLASEVESGGEDPLINFQGETKQCLIKKEDSVTTTVFMKR